MLKSVARNYAKRKRHVIEYCITLFVSAGFMNIQLCTERQWQKFISIHSPSAGVRHQPTESANHYSVAKTSTVSLSHLKKFNSRKIKGVPHMFCYRHCRALCTGWQNKNTCMRLNKDSNHVQKCSSKCFQFHVFGDEMVLMCGFVQCCNCQKSDFGNNNHRKD